ncbi:hypothetical protein CSOJ01_06260 [Colletotrichum sojae]|uniref:Uncharacterized protein n=1 Tax=Colletotrichum sojae TaxID=2175907 RepID=A0A8H6JDA6_9PEZI|nr:hypothetical protein CSOJ01_06260 [Colletotrichum sojae]
MFGFESTFTQNSFWANMGAHVLPIWEMICNMERDDVAHHADPRVARNGEYTNSDRYEREAGTKAFTIASVKDLVSTPDDYLGQPAKVPATNPVKRKRRSTSGTEDQSEPSNAGNVPMMPNPVFDADAIINSTSTKLIPFYRGLTVPETMYARKTRNDARNRSRSERTAEEIQKEKEQNAEYYRNNKAKVAAVRGMAEWWDEERRKKRQFEKELKKYANVPRDDQDIDG